MLESFFSAVGLKKLAFIAGMFGGGMSAGILPGPLAALSSLWIRIGAGAVCGGVIAGYGAEPLAEQLARPDYANGIALGLGFVGLTFFFKVLGGLNSVDFGAVISSWIKKGPSK